MLPIIRKLSTICLGVAVCVLTSVNTLGSSLQPTLTYVLYPPAVDPTDSASPGRDVSGPGPLTQTFILNVESPDALPVPPNNSYYTVGFNIAVTSVPTGAATADALSYVVLDPATMSFTGPSQTQTVSETVTFPAGAVAGDYAYLITTTGWPTISGYSIVDKGVYINLRVTSPQSPPSPPSILINTPPANSVYTYTAGGPALQIPFSFTGSTASTDPLITKVDADVSGTSVAVTASELGTTQVIGSGTIQVAAPGIYTLTARAYNSVGTSAAAVDFTVNVSGTAPAVTNLSPANGATFTYVTGASPLSIPVSCTATSAYGGITSVSATLDNSPIIGFSFTPSAAGSLTGTAASPTPLQFSAGGIHTLVVTVTDAIGTTTVTSQFTVVRCPRPQSQFPVRPMGFPSSARSERRP